MYFITKRDSETGKKFKEIDDKRQLINDMSDKLQEEVSADSYGFYNTYSFCGPCGFMFNTPPDSKIWKHNQKDNDYAPKISTKEGKEIREKMNAIPNVTRQQLNACVGLKDFWKVIGFNWGNPDFYAFSVREDWNVEIPSDCEEITVSRYRELFPQAN